MQRSITEVLKDLQVTLAAENQASGYYSAEAKETQVKLVTELFTATSFLTIMLQILPKALPLFITIFQEVRSGKKFLEALLGHLDQVIEVVLAIIPILAPQNAVPTNPALVAPK